MTTTLAGKRMKRMVLLGTLMTALAGCNTVAGVGEDVSGGARTVQDWLN
jgi:predicted small secreted protein